MFRQLESAKRRLDAILEKRVLLALVAVGFTLFITSVAIWPFRGQRLIRSLELLSVCEVKAQTFQPVFFPEPGYVATGLTFVRHDGGRPVVLAAVRRLRGHISWFSLVTLDHRIRELEADGLHVFIPKHVPLAPNYPREERLQAEVNHLDARGAELDVEHRIGVPKLHVTFGSLTVQHVGKEQSMTISAAVRNQFPEADLLLNGHFGPFIWSDLKRTAVAVQVQLNRMNLNHFESVGGMATGDGEVTGPFDHLKVSARIRVPDFHASNSRATELLSLESSSIVNGATGNIWILNAATRFLDSEVQARGNVIYGEDDRRRVELFLTSSRTRVENLLKLFLDKKPLVSGLMRFQGRAAFSTGPQPFLNRLHLTGDFRMDNMQFRNLQVQRRLDELSYRIRKMKFNRKASAAPVPSAVEGTLSAENGRAAFSSVALQSPGLTFRGAGVLSLIEPTIDIRGLLQTQSTLSRAVGGFKGMVAFPLNSFFQGQHGGSSIPFRIAGPFDDPSFKMSFRKTRKTACHDRNNLSDHRAVFRSLFGSQHQSGIAGQPPIIF